MIVKLLSLAGKSYRKTQWVPLQLITDTRRSLLSGFISKGGSHFTLEDAIHEDWLKVHRVIGRKCTNRGCYKYFVKWKGLPYSESTWEMQEDLKDDQVGLPICVAIHNITLWTNFGASYLSSERLGMFS